MAQHRDTCPGPCSTPASIHPLNRREWLKRSGNGFGLLALASLLERGATAGDATGSTATRIGSLPAKAKRCIFLFMTGGPSQMDLFDPKPLLAKLDGQPLPPSFGKIHSQFLESDPLCLASHRKWGRYGESGMDMSDLVPHLHKHADDIALIRSCVADSVIHAPAMYQMMTGRVLMGFILAKSLEQDEEKLILREAVRDASRRSLAKGSGIRAAVGLELAAEPFLGELDDGFCELDEHARRAILESLFGFGLRLLRGPFGFLGILRGLRETLHESLDFVRADAIQIDFLNLIHIALLWAWDRIIGAILPFRLRPRSWA